MIKPFHFNYQGKQFDAQLVFNFESLKDVIGIKFTGQTIMDDILFYRKGDTQWITTEPLQPQYAGTLNFINQQLETFFKPYQFSFKNAYYQNKKDYALKPAFVVTLLFISSALVTYFFINAKASKKHDDVSE